MTEDQEAQEAQELQMFGMARKAIRKMIDDQGNRPGGLEMLAMGLASDAQEEIERGQTETARKTLNVQKFVIDEIADIRVHEDA